METCFMNALKAFSFSKKTRFFTEYLAITNIAVSEEKSAAATFFKLPCSLKSTIFLPDWQNLTFKLCWVIGNILFYAYKAQISIFEGFDFASRYEGGKSTPDVVAWCSLIMAAGK